MCLPAVHEHVFKHLPHPRSKHGLCLAIATRRREWVCSINEVPEHDATGPYLHIGVAHDRVPLAIRQFLTVGKQHTIETAGRQAGMRACVLIKLTWRALRTAIRNHAPVTIKTSRGRGAEPTEM